MTNLATGHAPGQRHTRSSSGSVRLPRGSEIGLELRRQILSGELAPGEHLRLTPLSKEFGVAASVIREVLIRLVGQGLAVSTPNLGFSVLSLSASEILDLTEVRATFECTALEWSIERGDRSWEARLAAAHHMVSTAPRRKSPDDSDVSEEWADAHAAFHLALVAGCNNDRLLEIRTNLYEAAEVYRRWSNSPIEGPRRDVQGEHTAIFEATISRNAEQASALLGEHIRRTTTRVLERFGESEGVIRTSAPPR